MQSLRFEAYNIYILEKTIQYCGSVIAKSKKRVSWSIKHGEDKHSISCTLSFYSGKKIVVHNGYTIMNIVDSKECLDCVVAIGKEKMIFMVDEKTEIASVERHFIASNDEFLSFRNLYSRPVGQTYEKYFGK